VFGTPTSKPDRIRLRWWTGAGMGDAENTFWDRPDFVDGEPTPPCLANAFLRLAFLDVLPLLPPPFILFYLSSIAIAAASDYILDHARAALEVLANEPPAEEVRETFGGALRGPAAGRLRSHGVTLFLPWDDFWWRTRRDRCRWGRWCWWRRCTHPWCEARVAEVRRATELARAV